LLIRQPENRVTWIGAIMERQRLADIGAYTRAADSMHHLATNRCHFVQ
jgi:hypothetical protein